MTSQKLNILYGRLSQEDARAGDSNSIINQRLLLEKYAKDSSKKVRAVKKLQAERGERLGGRPPYGYKKVDKDSKEIIPDEDAAIIVKRIFAMCIAGKGPNQIARILSNEKIYNPTNYYYQAHGKGHRLLDTTHPYYWTGSTITAILDNMAYLGHTVGLRHTTISYKNKKAIIRPDHECVIVKNTHPALVTKEQWDIVQDLRKQKNVSQSIWKSRTSFQESLSAPIAEDRWYCTEQAQ